MIWSKTKYTKGTRKSRKREENKGSRIFRLLSRIKKEL